MPDDNENQQRAAQRVKDLNDYGRCEVCQNVLAHTVVDCAQGHFDFIHCELGHGIPAELNLPTPMEAT